MTTLPNLSLDLLPNPALSRAEPYGAHRAAILSAPALAAARREISAWEGYWPTPLKSLANLAAALKRRPDPLQGRRLALRAGQLQGARRRVCRGTPTLPRTRAPDRPRAKHR
ncbi:hypothetical protein ACTMU2_14590 [Cupriavidus basilensis]